MLKSKPIIRCYGYRSTRYGAYTKTYVLNDDLEIVSPLSSERSRSGGHGLDCYLPNIVEKARALIHIDISNSGKHYCKLELKKFNNSELDKKLIEKILEIHKCPRIIEDLVVMFPEHSEYIYELVAKTQ